MQQLRLSVILTFLSSASLTYPCPGSGSTDPNSLTVNLDPSDTLDAMSVLSRPQQTDFAAQSTLAPLTSTSLLNLEEPTFNEKIELSVKNQYSAQSNSEIAKFPHENSSSTMTAEFGPSAESGLKISLMECNKPVIGACFLVFATVKDKTEKSKILGLLNQISAGEGSQPAMACPEVKGPEYFVTLSDNVGSPVAKLKKQEWHATPSCPIGGFSAGSFEKVRAELVNYIMSHK